MAGGDRTGVLLINLGTPDSTSIPDVRRYLREFLSDPDVVDIPALRRWLLVNFVILPFRPAQSAEAYQKIWTEEGSPLLVNHLALSERVQSELGDEFLVEPVMRYGRPAIQPAVDRLLMARVQRLVAVPLFPQYSSSAFGSTLLRVIQVVGLRSRRIPIKVVEPFYEHPEFIGTWAELSRPHLEAFRPDHLVLTYHGVPERQIHKSDPTGHWCLHRERCCRPDGPLLRYCYRAQCHQTTHRLLPALGWDPSRASTAFQSRLGSTPWIQPYTDEHLQQLRSEGVRRVALISPSFVADCLETLEEIGMEAREDWLAAGGEDLMLVPSLNAHPRWARAVAAMVRRRAQD